MSDLPDLNKLDELLTRRKSHSKPQVMSIFFIFWGVMNIVGVWLFELFFYSGFFWLVWIPTGVLFQVILIRLKFTLRGIKLWTLDYIPWIFAFALSGLPFLCYIFPFLMHLYPDYLIFPLCGAWMGFTSLSVGLVLGRPSIIFSGFVFFLGIPAHLLFPTQSAIVFSLISFFSLIIPGVWSIYEER